MCFGFCFFLLAQSTTQHVSIDIEPINEIMVNSVNPTFTITTGEPGDLTLSAIATGSTIDYTTNAAASANISVELDAAFPSSLMHLQVNITPPTGADANTVIINNDNYQNPQVALSFDFLKASPPERLNTGIPITYTFNVEYDAGVHSFFNRTAIFTLTGI